MGSQEQIAVSVVIPTRGRETRLAFALDSLAEQTLDPGAFEVIVVRDSDDEPQRAEVPDRLNCRILTLPGVPPPPRSGTQGGASPAAR